MTYEINGGETPPINFAPVTIAEEVMQNVRMIISTIKYSVPMDREFGIDGAVVDRKGASIKRDISSGAPI